ncbi:MAG: flagellar basal body L-ring protein FlgH [Spirochaetales bacterium]|nr:flagellar basal body L-ring protein FlgH [Spirochaetales bacterium]
MKWSFFIIALFFSGGLLSADSLWDDQFQGYISGSSAFRAGDIVTIVIDSSLSLNFAAASKNAKSITFEFSGGQYGGLFSFLPNGRTGDDRSVNGKENYSLKTELAAGVTAVDPSGKLLITGTRTVQLGGKREAVTVSGRVDPKAVDSSGRFNFSQIEGSRLTFTSLLQPSAATLTTQDIQEIVKELEAGPSGGPTTQTTVQLTDQKKKELLLLYLNRLVDIIFR